MFHSLDIHRGHSSSNETINLNRNTTFYDYGCISQVPKYFDKFTNVGTTGILSR